MSITVYTAKRTPILLESKHLGSPGGEGTVYEITGNHAYPNHCVKVYHPEKLSGFKKEKLEYLTLHRPPNYLNDHYKFCWPEELVFNSANQFIGYIMPLAFGGSEKLYELTTLKLPKRLGLTWQKFDRAYFGGFQRRLKLCLPIAFAVHNLHVLNRYLIVDLKPQNILLDVDGRISITDVDSFQIFSGTNLLYRAEALTEDYAPIEYHYVFKSKNTATENWDRFAMAVTFYEILFGAHPYGASCNEAFFVAPTLGEKIKHGLFVHGIRKNALLAIPHPHNNFTALPLSIKTLFNRAFAIDGDNEVERPSAMEWGNAIHEAVK